MLNKKQHTNGETRTKLHPEFRDIKSGLCSHQEHAAFVFGFFKPKAA